MEPLENDMRQPSLPNPENLLRRPARNLGNLLERYAFRQGQSFRHKVYVRRLVSLAPVRRGRKPGRIGFEHDPVEWNAGYALGQTGVFEGYDAPDADHKPGPDNARSLFGRTREAVKYAPQAVHLF